MILLSLSSGKLFLGLGEQKRDAGSRPGGKTLPGIKKHVRSNFNPSVSVNNAKKSAFSILNSFRMSPSGGIAHDEDELNQNRAKAQAMRVQSLKQGPARVIYLKFFSGLAYPESDEITEDAGRFRFTIWFQKPSSFCAGNFRPPPSRSLRFG